MHAESATVASAVTAEKIVYKNNYYVIIIIK